MQKRRIDITLIAREPYGEFEDKRVLSMETTRLGAVKIIDSLTEKLLELKDKGGSKKISNPSSL